MSCLIAVLKHASAALVLLLSSHVWPADADQKDSYRPYPHSSPQIIQAHDYPTIEAIEALFRSLTEFGQDDVACQAELTGIVFQRRTGGRRVTVAVPEQGPVAIAGRAHSANATFVLFRTLKRIVTDLSQTSPCSGVRSSQFATRAYARRTVVEFDFGSTVVVLGSLSNGPRDEERLYVLDIVQRQESFFWGRSLTDGTARPVAIADAEPLRFRIGWAHPSLPGVAMYSPPRAGAWYSVLSSDGAVAFTGQAHARKEQNCDGSSRRVWHVAAPTLPLEMNSYVVLIETPADARLPLQPVSAGLARTPSEMLLRYGDLLASERRLRNYSKTFYEVGQRADRSRLVLFIVGEPTPPQGPAYVMVSVVDVAGTTISKAETYIQRATGGDLFAELLGVADTDGDGLADVILIWHGDFYGARLLLKSRGRWSTQKDDLPGPC